MSRKKVSLEEVVFLPPDIRRGFDFSNGKMSFRKKPKKEKRKVYSRDKLIEYLIENNFDSVSKLNKGRKSFEPHYNDYMKFFGSWSNAKRLAFGEPLKIDLVDKDAAYLVKVVIEFGIWRYNDWQEASKSNPLIVPSISVVRREWGSFSNMINYAYQVSIKSILDRYINLWQKIGKTPTIADCNDGGINLEMAVKHFGSKREMDSFLKGLGI